ncbi:MAG: arylsulfatase [Cyanobacteriota bacterium]|nr:arylsulfatase [Cyanobacteriota bacterium]
MPSHHDRSRHVLPIPDQAPVGLTTFDAKDPDTNFPPICDLRPPQGAPNVLVILLDDVGFGASSAFGGPCQTPRFEQLASEGLKYNRFHTTALCSPTRQAMLTGRNHHSVGMGGITEIATSAPGYNSLLPNTCSPIARTLKLNGYATAQFGKCHEVPVWQTSPMGPFDAWPSAGGGFEYFYGFIGGETNQYYPAIYEGTTPIEPPATPEEGYHFTDDMTTKAIRWVHQQKALMPDKPFFMYVAPGATHAPHHVPQEWADRYKGRFDQGWDVVRQQTFDRQKQLGVIPADAELTARHDQIPAWDAMPEALKPVLARQMEVYAGFLEHTDYHMGRLVDALRDLEVINDTLIYVIIGDNGASAEGSLQGCFNEMAPLTGFGDLETADFLTERLDLLGGPEAYNHYAVGWAHAMNTPYQWSKQVASHWGGTRNGLIVHWPNGIQARGEVRSQFHHVIDIAPTLLDVAGLPQPSFVNGVQQRPIEGVSMAYSFDDPEAPERRQTQYFEMAGNRGIYHQGWTAVTRHRTPWETGGVKLPAFDEDVWELYDTNSDWTQAHDLADADPDRLKHLQRLWLIEATKYNVLPLDDRFAERANPAIAGRPQLIQGQRQILYAGMGRLTESSIINFKNRSHAITAEVVVPAAGAEGVIVTQGGIAGGWTLYAKRGCLTYVYNFYGVEHTLVGGATVIPEGTHQVRMEFAYDGGGMAKGGMVSLFVNGLPAGAGRVERTEPILFSADETCDVGYEAGSPVTRDLTTPQGRFSGQVNWVEIAVDEAASDADHLLSAQERYRVAMALQ